MSGENLAGGVVLKAHESKFGAATFQPVMTAGVGEHHHAEAGTAQAASAELAGGRFCGEANLAAQNGAHALAADRQMLFAVKFLTEMRIVEASILAAGQFEDGAPQRHGQSPRHGPSAVAVMHPIDAVGTIARRLSRCTCRSLNCSRRAASLTLSRPPTAFSITFTRWNSFCPHCHHPSRVTKSGCS